MSGAKLTGTQNEQQKDVQVQSDIRAYMHAGVVGAFKVSWRLFEFLHVNIISNAERLIIQLEAERKFLLRCPYQLLVASQPYALET